MQKSSKGAGSDVVSGTSGLGNGASAQLGLWKRSAQQAVDPSDPDYTLDSTDSLDSISREAVTLFDLSSSTGTLAGPNLKVFYSKSTSDGPGNRSPSLSSWSGRRIPWDTNEFKAFMLYAHGSKAIRYMTQLYPTLSFSVRNKGLLPLHAYSSVDDNPLKTKYEVNKDGRVGNILFYQEEDASTVRYNPVDESDTVYHEFAHAFQHILNPNVLETGGNYDVDMLLEGLADYFAAAAVRDDRILEYLAANSPHLFSSDNRTGRVHRRQMANSLYFPNSYVGDFHLDARIVSSAINDVRKYLEGQTVTLLQNCGSSCTVRWNTTKPMNRSDAFDMANILAHDALREIIPTSSIVHYSERFIAAANRKTWTNECGSSSTCKNELVTELTSILKSRGIHARYPVRCASGGTCNPAFDITSATPELRLNNNGNMYFAPIFSGSGESNSDSVLDRCEAILAIPDISVRSGVQASSYDTIFEIYDSDANTPQQVTGFSSFNGIDILTENEPFFDTTELEAKLWGFLLPGESSFSLAGVPSSRYYASHQQSVFSPALSAIRSSNPPPAGWALRAPSSAGATGWVEFAFSTRPFEIRYVTEDVYTIRSLKQKLTVSNSANNFCN